MLYLAKKTIKALSFELSYHSDLTNSQELELIKQIDANKTSNPENCAVLKRQLRSMRKKWSRRFNYTYNYKGVTVSTFYKATKEYNPKAFDNRREARVYILRRIKEKINEFRAELKKDKIDLCVYKEIDYYKINGLFDVKKYLTETKLKVQLEVINREKRPFSDNCVGAEIEFISQVSETKLKRSLCDAGLAKYVFLKYDGSVEPTCDDADCDDDGEIIDRDDYHGYELNIIAPENIINSIVNRSIDVIKGTGGYVNATCGLHIHLDMRNRNHKKCFYNLVTVQDFLYKIASSSRSHNSYCKYTDSPEFDNEDNSDRYCGINGQSAYSKFETIEVRILEGTLNKDKINNWINLLIKIVNLKDKLSKSTDKWSEIKELLSVDSNDNFEYIERVAS